MKFFRLFQEGDYDDGSITGPSFVSRELAEKHMKELLSDAWEIQEFEILESLPVICTDYTLQIGFDVEGNETLRRLTPCPRWDYEREDVIPEAQITVGNKVVYVYGWGTSKDAVTELVESASLRAIEKLISAIHERAKLRGAR